MRQNVGNVNDTLLVFCEMLYYKASTQALFFQTNSV